MIDQDIRPEQDTDERVVEELTREAFWNKYHPGCTEHYVLHQLRKHPDCIRELNFVIEAAGKIVGHIIYSRTTIRTEDGKILPVITFGPVSVLPEYQNRGFGSRLIRFSLEQAAALGYGAVAITGNPDYYRRFGFVPGYGSGIRYSLAKEGDEAPYFMVKELKPGFLQGIRGTFYESPVFFPEEAEVEAFDGSFVPREKRNSQVSWSEGAEQTLKNQTEWD